MNSPAHDTRIVQVSVVTCLLALALLVPSWIRWLSTNSSGVPLADLVLVPLLVAGIFVARSNPIHIRRSTKVYVTSVLYFLIAVVLPPALAATVVAVGLFTSAWTMRKRTGNGLAMIGIQTARWVVIVLIGSLLAHLATADQLEAFGLAAAFMFAGDILTFPLLYTPLHGDSPIRVIRLVAREAGPVEGAQYLIGVMAALQLPQRPYALVLFILPTFLVWWAFKQAKDVSDETHEMLLRLADTVDMRDPYTGGHSRRVAELTQATLKTLSMRGPEVEIIIDAARVHDIGKIGIPDAILLKPSPLTPDEQAVMDTHPEQGAQLLERYADWSRGVAIIRHHHEAWDGSGYPHRLKGHEIEFGARVIAVADAYDAMTTERPYRRAMSPDAAAAVLREGRGRQWDGEVVDAFLVTIAHRLERPGSALLRVVPDYREEPASSA